MTKHRRRKRLPKQRCELVFETWGPHPGCAEYMDEPEVHVCRDSATHLVKVPASTYLEPRRMRACKWHANCLKSETVRVYRYRTVR